MAQGNVELWLMSLMTIAQRSLHGVIKTAAMAVQDSSLEIIEFLNSYQAQVRTTSILPSYFGLMIHIDIGGRIGLKFKGLFVPKPVCIYLIYPLR